MLSLIKDRIPDLQADFNARGIESRGWIWGRAWRGLGLFGSVGEGDVVGLGKERGGGRAELEHGEGKWLKVGMWEYGRTGELDGRGDLVARLEARDRGFGGELIWIIVVLGILFWLVSCRKRCIRRRRRAGILKF